MHNNYFPEYIFNNNFNKNDTKEAKTKTVKWQQKILCSIVTTVFLFGCHINFTLFFFRFSAIHVL